MSIFDVIRYPISDTPTGDQLAALPRSLYEKWVQDIYEHQIMRNPSVASERWFYHPHAMAKTVANLSDYQRNEYVNELRLRIQEIE